MTEVQGFAGLGELGVLEDALSKGINRSPLEYRDDEHSVRADVEWHMGDLRAYIRQRYARSSEAKHLRDLLAKPPQLARTVLENHLLTDDEKVAKLVEIYRREESVIAQVIGQRGRRKTITTWDFVDVIRKEIQSDVYSTAEEGKIPEWATSIIRIEDAPEHCIIVEDELAAERGARTSISRDQRTTPAFFATLRQRRQHYFGILQNTATGDLSVPLFADILIVKPLSFFQLATERPAVRKALETWDELLPRDPWETLLLSSFMHPLSFSRPIPEWWERDFSRSYSAIESMPTAIRRATALRRGHLAWTTISTRMASRGWPRPAEWWADKVRAWNGGKDPMPGARARKERDPAKGPVADPALVRMFESILQAAVKGGAPPAAPA